MNVAAITSNIDRFSLDDIVALSAEARALEAEYAALGLDVPSYIADACARVRAKALDKAKDALIAQIQRQDAVTQSYESRATRRASSEADAKALRERLAKLTNPPAATKA